MRPVRLQTFRFETAVSFKVKDLVEREVEDKIFSWGHGYHDAWVALYDAIEG